MSLQKKILSFIFPTGNRFSKAQRGTTMMELMVTVGLMVVVSGGALVFLVTQSRTQQAAGLKANVLTSGQIALAIMAEILQAWYGNKASND